MATFKSIVKVAKNIAISQRTGKPFNQLAIIADTDDGMQLFNMLLSSELMMQLMLNGVTNFDNMVEVQAALNALNQQDMLVTNEDYSHSLMLKQDEE